MLAIIKQGRPNLNLVTNQRRVSRPNINEDEVTCLRAPGISSAQPESILRPIARAATMPTQYKQHNSVDFEPFKGPSLFTNFRKLMTSDEKIKRWQVDGETTLAPRKQPEIAYQSTPVCGTNTKEVKHVYMTSGSHRPGTAHNALREHYLPPCKQCTILCETLERLRQNLSLSGPSSPKAEVEFDVLSARPEDTLADRCNDALKSETYGQQSFKPQGARVRPARIGKTDSMQWQDEVAQRPQRAAETRRLPARKQFSITEKDLMEARDVVKDKSFDRSLRSQQCSTDSEAGPAQFHSLPEAKSTSRLDAYQRQLEILEEQMRSKLEVKARLVKQRDDNAPPSLQAPASRIPKTKEHIEAKQAYEQAQALRTREDPRLQRLNNPIPDHERYRLSNEKDDSTWLSTTTNYLRHGSLRPGMETMGQLEGHLEHLEAQLTEYVRSARGMRRTSVLEEARRTEE